MSGGIAYRFGVAAAATTFVVVLAACGGGSGPGAPSPTAPASGTTTPAGALWAPPSDAPLPAAMASRLQATLDGWVTAKRVVGVTAAVLTPTGAWAGAAGVDGVGTRLQPTSAAWAASITKTVTAAEVMLLASRGKLDLDVPVTRYVRLPWDAKGATVRQLLTMTSGFPDADPTLFPALARDPNREWTIAQRLAAVPANAPRAGELGMTPHYNDLNYGVLAAVVEKVTGTTWAAAVRTDLLGPAGLTRIWAQTAETPGPPLAVGTDAKGVRLSDPTSECLPSRAFASAKVGSANLAADAPSLARWAYLLYGGYVIDAALVQQMEAGAQLEETMQAEYAIGTMIGVVDGVRIVGHGGGNSDTPASSMMLVWTDTPTAVVVTVPQPAPTDGGGQAPLAFELHDVAAAGQQSS